MRTSAGAGAANAEDAAVAAFIAIYPSRALSRIANPRTYLYKAAFNAYTSTRTGRRTALW